MAIRSNGVTIVGMKINIFSLVAFGYVLCSAQTATAPQAKRIFIEEGLKTAELTTEITKKCPAALVVTDNHNAADYDLRVTPGNSTLYKQNGNVAYNSAKRFDASNLAGDICNYAGSQQQDTAKF